MSRVRIDIEGAASILEDFVTMYDRRRFSQRIQRWNSSVFDHAYNKHEFIVMVLYLIRGLHFSMARKFILLLRKGMTVQQVVDHMIDLDLSAHVRSQLMDALKLIEDDIVIETLTALWAKYVDAYHRATNATFSEPNVGLSPWTFNKNQDWERLRKKLCTFCDAKQKDIGGISKSSVFMGPEWIDS